MITGGALIMYMWLRQILVFYVISTLIVNSVVTDRYRKYIKLITRLMLILIVLEPVIKFTGSADALQKQMDKLYTSYNNTYSKAVKSYKDYNDKSADKDDYGYNVETVLVKTVKLKVNEILNEYNMSADYVDVVIENDEDAYNVNTYSSDTYNDAIRIKKITIKINKLNKSDMIRDIKEKISRETGVDEENILVK